jgi:putative transposase
MLAVNDLATHVGMKTACRAFAFNPGYVYRDRARRRGIFTRHPIAVRPRPPLALSIAEQDYLLGVLDSERFVDTAPATIYATLLDEGHYHGSVRTMYPLLAAQNQAGDPTERSLELGYFQTQGTSQVDVLSLVCDHRYF